VERGRHDELLALGGRYKELYDLQAEFGNDPGIAAPERAPEDA
jgi:hypothetical protein